jgi:hypothetical protein
MASGGFMTSLRTAVIATTLIAASGARLSADATLFIGANTTPENRHMTGFAVGTGLLLVGFEFEYAHAPEDGDALAPELSTGMGNVLLQTPFMIFGFQPYVTTGAGLYRETLGSRRETGVALTTGGGVKVGLIGPLRLRVDYRVVKLGSGALYSPAHRVYAGINLKF